VCFGTLAQRSDLSRATIHRFLNHATNAVRLFDVNLRQHYFGPKIIVESLKAATAVKLSADELQTVGELVGFAAAATPADHTARALCELFGLQVLALTRGAAGTVIYSSGARFEVQPAPYHPRQDADSVGAGDACCAGVLYGLLAGWPPERTLELANQLGAFVASQPGATPQLPDDLIPLPAS
jgi:fructokinase